MERLIGEIKPSHPAPGPSGIFYPGGIETMKGRNKAIGIELSEAVTRDPSAGANQIGLPHPF